MSGINVGDLFSKRYQIESQLGRGGFGSTYLAHDNQLDDKVVIKELLERWTKAPEICRRFVNEAQALRRVRDPNVIAVYDLLTPKSVPELKQYCIIMEYMPGGSVESRMRKGLTLEETVKIAIDVCRGLNHAHELGIVHRDIKPANILLTSDLSVVKICDFGIAHLPDKTQTTGSMHPGTLLYMAPEAFGREPGQKIDGRADLYSLAVTLYQLLTGKDYLNYEEFLLKAEQDLRREFRLGPDVELNFEQQIKCQLEVQRYWMEAVCTQMPPDPRQHNPKIPISLAEIVMHGLAKDPDQRQAGVKVMAEELEKVRLSLLGQTMKTEVVATNWQLNEIIVRSMDAARQNQLTVALELIQHAISLVPNNARAYATLANIQMLRGELASASKAWQKVLEVAPNYPETYSKLGQCYNRLGQIDKAIEIQKQGLNRPENHENAPLFYGLANSFQAAGRWDEAIWALERSLQIRPDPKLETLLNHWKANESRSH